MEDTYMGKSEDINLSNREEERDAKAKAGQKIALNGHTFRDRVAVMVKVIREMPL